MIEDLSVDKIDFDQDLFHSDDCAENDKKIKLKIFTESCRKLILIEKIRF